MDSAGVPSNFLAPTVSYRRGPLQSCVGTGSFQLKSRLAESPTQSPLSAKSPQVGVPRKLAGPWS